MSRIDYTSIQSVELTTPNGYREAEIAIGLECTDTGCPPSFDPYTGGDPGAGPEFDLVNIALIDESGNSVDIDSLIITAAILKSFLGEEIYDAMIEDAIIDATDNFGGIEYDD